ncbi:hypothetical protein OSB04_024386 [Centaurea solstitialis]|uniref:Uncharacterized protein n=1 Tax=Centaurea solstitialis TaxID=347529 RepID=A0AA38SL11_9ASTR|nr:hypothetical protein OSB04_024386 [Centaurea solstitialis]
MANTVTNINNLSLRSILENDKLTGSNFLGWERNLQIVLRHERKWYVLEEPLGEALPANASAAIRNAYQKCSGDLLDVGCLMLATMSPELQTGLMNTNAYDMIRWLRDMFQTQCWVQNRIVSEITSCQRVFELNQENIKLSSDKSLLEMKIVDLEKSIQSEKGQESENSKLSNQITELQQSLSVLNAAKAELILKVTNLEEDKKLFENKLIYSHSRVIELSNQVNDFEKIVIIERSNFEKERRAFEAKVNELSLKTLVFDKPKDSEIFKEFSESNCYVNYCYDDDDSKSYDEINVFDSLDSCTNKKNVVDSKLVDFEKMFQNQRKVCADERKVFEEERNVFEKERKSFELKSEKLLKKISDLERQIVSERKSLSVLKEIDVLSLFLRKRLKVLKKKENLLKKRVFYLGRRLLI